MELKTVLLWCYSNIIWVKVSQEQLYQISFHNISKDLATHSWESHRIVYLTWKLNHTRKFEGIQMKSSSLGVHNEDNGRNSQSMVSTIWLVNRILATVIISFLSRFSGNFLLFLSCARLIHWLLIMCFIRQVCGWS